MIGTRISHYRIDGKLGRGGMGEVYAATDLDLDRQVALKFVTDQFAADPDTLRRFEREARSAAALSHPHIATLFAFERGERPLIAMELLRGGSLRARMVDGPVPIEVALGWARDIASGLALAHRRGVVHRDIKPENLMFDDADVIKIVDFGLARAAQASRLTMTGTTLGTAAYMSPEAIRGEGREPADVWAVGVMLYEMVAGARPFTGDDNPLSMMFAIANEAPVPLRERRPDVPEAVADLLDRILNKDPAIRPDAITVARELAALTGVAAPALPSIPAETDGASPPPGAVISGAVTAPMGPASDERTEEVEVERMAAGVPARTYPQPHGTASPWSRRRVIAFAVPILAIAIAVVAWMARASHGPSAGARRESLVLNNRGQQEIVAGDFGGARTTLERAVALDPSNAAAALNLGQVYRHEGIPASAESLFSIVIAQPGATARLRAQAHYGLADLDLDAGAWDGAIDHLHHALATDSSWAGPYNDLGYALVKAGRPREAEQVLAAASRRFAGEPALLKNLALALMQQGRLVEARSHLDEALRIDPAYGPAYGVRARVRARAHDMTGARDDFERFAASGPDPGALRAVREDLEALGVSTAVASAVH